MKEATAGLLKTSLHPDTVKRRARHRSPFSFSPVTIGATERRERDQNERERGREKEGGREYSIGERMHRRWLHDSHA